MAKEETTAKKLLPIFLFEVLKKYTDAEHVLTQNKIAQKIEEEYGLKIERKAIGRNIKLLCEAGYEIETRNGKGFCFLGRLFEDTELWLLIDGIRLSRHVNKQIADSICLRLAELGTVGFREENSIKDVSSFARNNTIELFHSIDVLKNAIFRGKKVAFRYFEYGVDGKFQSVWDEKIIVSPRELVYSNGNYYLIGQIEGNDGFTNFRLEKIKDIKRLKTDCNQFLELNLKQYLSEHPLMYCGEPLTAKMKVKRFLMDSVWEFFGNEVMVIDSDGDEDLDWVEVTVCADRWAILEFALNNGSFAEVLSPKSLRQRLRKMAYDILEKYSDLQEGIDSL